MLIRKEQRLKINGLSSSKDRKRRTWKKINNKGQKSIILRKERSPKLKALLYKTYETNKLKRKVDKSILRKKRRRQLSKH